MPRYFFHLRNGKLTEDSDGKELADIAAARQQARRIARELVEAGESPKASIVVADDHRLLFEINLLAR